MADDFNIDPRTKYGDADWEGDDFTTFVDDLNRGVVVRTDSVPGESASPADISVDEIAKLKLRDIFSRYQ